MPDNPKGGSDLSRATHPETTVWVSANAGSGKTYVLSRRVIRLLLEGAKPSELLCLTFTKVAASEMANKVFEILGEWALLDDAGLGEQIKALTGKPADKNQLRRARHLFATALDTPGGLRIQTIHAFCEALLHQFPLEANIPGHFDLMAEMDQTLLLDEARRRVVLAGLGAKRGSGESDFDASVLRDAFKTIQEHASDHVIEQTISQMIGQREMFFDWIERGGGSVEHAFSRVWNEFELSPQSTEKGLVEAFFEETAYEDDALQSLIGLAQVKGKKSYDELANQLLQIGKTKDANLRFKLRCEVFLKKDMEPRASLVHHTFLKKHEDQLTLFQEEQALLLSQLDQLKSLKVLKASEAMFTIVNAILVEYGNLKQRRGLLDFDDLIAKSANLLNRSEISGWIQYKLDAGIRHVLVDEAQDTSPLQWQIIEAITSEFYAGLGIERGVRTLFVVGDEKQSIYSFQGADPEEFSRQFKRVMSATEGAGQKSDKVPLTVSYRSTEEVLGAVDQVFSLEENRKGLSETGLLQTHSAKRQSDRGEVFIWPLVRKPEKAKREDWLAPLDKSEENDAEVQLAERIASTIKSWIDCGETLPGRNRPIRNGDILILVRKRDRFVPAVNRALKNRGLVSAGYDRLRLTEHIAVEDMIALGRFASNSLDDLALAGILKSPLFGLSEEVLFEIAHDRGEQTLFEAIKNAAEAESPDGIGKKLADIRKILSEILALARSLPVYEFYARIFATNDLRKKYLARLGHEVEEILDGFFQAALDYDNRSGLGLTGFVEWLAGSSPELKREIDMESDEIRVITVHSSKGLEAPIVFLVDPGSKAYSESYAPKVISLEHGHRDPYLLWQSKTANRVIKAKPRFEEIAEKAEEEYRRLLYVGMTRAADRLIVCGYGPEDIKHDHWHSMVLSGLGAPIMNEKLNGRLEEVRDESGKLAAWQWLIDNPNYREKVPELHRVAERDALTQRPNWFRHAKTEPVIQRPLSPSGVLAMLDIVPESGTENAVGGDLALIRGNLVHQLLQALPELSVEKRETFARKWFQANYPAGSLPNDVFEEILASVTAILGNEQMLPLFADGSRAEVEIAGTLTLASGPRRVRGKIDRLAVTGKTVFLADYKTNRKVPDSADQVSEQYLAQMALYRELLRAVYPGRAVQSLIVWTQNNQIMPIDDGLLDKQMIRLNSA